MQLNNLKRIHKWKKSTPVGRGSKRGKTSGRGTKGQKSRAGRKLRPEIRDVIMRLPKLRGRGTNSFVSRFVKPSVIKLDLVNKYFKDGDTVNPDSLVKAGLIRENVRKNGVKIVGGGKIEKKINLVGVSVTASVKEMIEKLGGSIK
jgi:large subunit ribosomal protein L15